MSFQQQSCTMATSALLQIVPTKSVSRFTTTKKDDSDLLQKPECLQLIIKRRKHNGSYAGTLQKKEAPQ